MQKIMNSSHTVLVKQD